MVVIKDSQPQLLCIQDPLDPKNDVGRRSYKFNILQARLVKLVHEIKTRSSRASLSPSVLPLPVIASGWARKVYDSKC